MGRHEFQVLRNREFRWHAVICRHSGAVRVEAGENRASRGSAKGGGAKRVGKNRAPIHEPPEMWGMNVHSADTGQSVHSLLVANKEHDVRLLVHGLCALQ